MLLGSTADSFIWWTRLICLGAVVIGYGFGLFQSAYIISKARHVDIYSKGSGNPGTTNMFRVMGAGFGTLTFVLDVTKVVLAIFATRLLFLSLLHMPIDPVALTLYTGLGAVLGHNYPFYLRGKGGKGVASTVAVYCCLGNWQLIVIGVVIFFSIFFITRYVSLASLAVVTASMIEFCLFSTVIGWIPVAHAWIPDCHILVCIFAGMVFYTHRQNIVRLAHGEEKKFVLKKTKPNKQ